MSDTAFTSKNSRVWIQPGGANKPLYLLSCSTLGDIQEDKGALEVIRCLSNDGKGWTVVGETTAPPEKVTTSIESLLFQDRDWLEKIDCPYALYVMSRKGGRADLFSNYIRGQIVANARTVTRTYAGMVSRDEDAPATLSADIEAWPPLLDIDLLSIVRLTTSSALALNDIWANPDERCAEDFGGVLDAGSIATIVCDSAAGPAKAAVLLTTNSGSTWTATAAQPGDAGENLQAVTRFFVGATTRRILVAQEKKAAGQGKVHYSDDNGATWSTVNIGGATAAQGAVKGKSLFALDANHIWLASALGYIYFSSDGGQTWTAQNSGTVTAGDYQCIHFADALVGIAGAAAGIVAVTRDGGANWSAATAISGTPVVNTCFAIDEYRLWVGCANGKLYYTEDGGVTWTERAGWSGSGVGQVKDLFFFNEYQGFMLSNTAAPVGTVLRTINGGTTWEAITTPTNSGLNTMAVVNENIVYAVGEVNTATGVILRVTA